MQIHHLNCISTCPLGGKIMDAGQESVFSRGRLTNHCLLIESASQCILVDTGLGVNDVANPGSRLSRFFLTLVSPDFREEMTAIRQIEKLGYDPKDVRHIVLTHLDFDHAGGLDDFPHAHVHMMGAERDYAIQQKTWLDRQRFRPQQWSTQANWKVYDAGEGETWFGFHRVQTLHGLPPEIVMIPLLGHTLGHAGIAVQTEGKWLLLAGDAYFFHQEMHPDAPWCTPGLAFYQRMMEKDHKTRIMNQKRLRELRRSSPEVEIFCSHDVREFEKLSGRSAGIPTEQLVSR
jgi:glyoxylase-like metal-dependent hydrolase (beta-lactamase superfamily II)